MFSRNLTSFNSPNRFASKELYTETRHRSMKVCSPKRSLRVMLRTLRERFGEHLRSINKNAPGFPVAEHFSSNGHTAADSLVRVIKLCDGNKPRGRGRRCALSFVSGHASRAASMLIFSSFEVRTRNFQILNQIPTLTNIPLMKGTVPKRLDICYNFGTFSNILIFYFLIGYFNAHYDCDFKACVE